MRRTVRRFVAALAAGVMAGSLLFAAPALAVDNPDPTQPTRVPSPNAAPRVVWRVDSRPPGVIFSNGFRESGEDDNLLASMNNATNERAYVPTTTNPMFFHDFAHGAALTNYIWVYEIRATGNFYNATGSIEWVRDNPAAPTRIRAVAEDTIDAFRNQQEWSALGGIPREQIIRGGRLQLSVLEANPTRNPIDLVDRWWWFGGYVSADTHANDYLVTNPAFNGINEPNRPYGCEPSRSNGTSQDQCQFGGFRLDPVADPFDGKQFSIRPKADPSRALDVNQTTILYPAHEGGTQTFIPVRDSATGRYRIKNLTNGLYLNGASAGVYGNATFANATLWYFELQSDGWYRILANGPGGNQLTRNQPGSVQMTVNGSNWGDWNRWSFNPIGGNLTVGRPYQIKPSMNTLMVAHAAGENPVGGANVSITGFSLNSNTQWYPTYDPARGAYRFRNGATANYHLAWEASWTNGRTNVVVWDGNYDDQYWIVRQNIAGFSELVNYSVQTSGSTANYKVLNLAGSQNVGGTNIDVATYNGGQNQQWVLGQTLR